MKNLSLSIVSVLAILINCGVSYPVLADERSHAEYQKSDGQVVTEKKTEEFADAGNKICPVSGEKVGSMGPGVQVKHEGKIYYLCCAMCEGEFLRDPANYAGIAQEGVGAGLQEVEGQGRGFKRE